VYIDDGLDSHIFTKYSNGLNLNWDSSALTLQAGLIYKLKYSSTNTHGESELSDEVSILLAEIPAQVDNFRRIDNENVQAGDVRVAWALPQDEGADPVLGFRLYLDSVLWHDASMQSTFNNFTFTGLSVGQLYKFSVSAVNDIGES
jgi:hypothetical protein